MTLTYSTFGVGYTVCRAVRGRSYCLGLVWQEYPRHWYARDNGEGMFGPFLARKEAGERLLEEERKSGA